MKWLLSYPEDGPSVAWYEQWVRAAGAEPVLLDADYSDPGDLHAFGALLLSGGGDVDPARYGDPCHARTGGILPVRDALELSLIREFRRLGRPIFGICRGQQILNVALGGGLLQHVPDLVPPHRERHSRGPDYDSIHALEVDAGTRLGRALASARETNSAHHQAVDPARIGRGLRVAARSGLGIIEAVEGDDGTTPLMAVQWHPERLPLEHPASAGLRELWAGLAR
jgi:putative glutamine amidotransferase